MGARHYSSNVRIKMQFYDKLDFLEFFDVETVEDAEAGYIKYDVTSSDNITLSISMNIYEGWVYFRISSPHNTNLVDFDVNNIKNIICDKSEPGIVKFLFFKLSKQFPIATIYIKPTLSLSLDIDQKENIK